jgi:hypothetical protein
MPRRRYPCPCCGYLVFEQPPGSSDICPICFWEDDLSQLRFPTAGGGANRPSLLEAQRAFAQIGAVEARLREHVRSPGPSDARDPLWRPLDPLVDQIEEALDGVDYGLTYPSDPTTLYYWRPTYWRHGPRLQHPGARGSP